MTILFNGSFHGTNRGDFKKQRLHEILVAGMLKSPYLGSKIPLHTNEITSVFVLQLGCRCFLIIVFVVETMTAKQSVLVLMSFLYHRLTFL